MGRFIVEEKWVRSCALAPCIEKLAGSCKLERHERIVHGPVLIRKRAEHPPSHRSGRGIYERRESYPGQSSDSQWFQVSCSASPQRLYWAVRFARLFVRLRDDQGLDELNPEQSSRASAQRGL